MADLGSLNFGVHLIDYTDAEADKIKKKLENLSVKLTIDGKNVNISHTDLIKKQIEDAIKSVSVQSVKVDTNAIKTQVSSAFQGINPQISVTLLKGALSNDLQNYLNSKTFNVGISISKGNAQNAVNTAFANLSVPVSVTVKASAVAQQIQQSLANAKAKVGVEAKDVNAFISDIEKRLKGRKIKIDVEPNQQHLVQAVKQALQGVSVKAQVTVDVDAQKITNAVQAAINNARFTYNPTGGRGSGSSGGQRGGSSNWGQRASHGLYESARASVTLGRSLSTNIRIAGELGTTLGNLASIFRIKEILSGVIQIGGQLENQKIALGAILQDGGKATEMFGKIQSLAVKSPFGIMDLNQYTKQLSAYGIEYNELYDTMKRMADISAGVGVDMGRIILAFGQVKAAGFLKGTEMRQFTEANIPMVEKLAEKFSILEKRIVSAGEVYDMISEKKVTFQDVKDVLWSLTDEGGMFNNMQEVLSESLASKWKNLSDAIDVMYGKIAEGSVGGFAKALAEGLTELTKQWEYIAVAIKGATIAYIAYKATVSLGNKQLNDANNLYKTAISDKQKEANSLRLTSIYRQLTRAEQNLIATSNALNVADMKRLIRAKMLNKEEAMRLIYMGKLDAATTAYLARVFKINLAQVNATNSTNWWNRALISLGNTMRTVGAAMKSFFLNPWTIITTALTAGMEVYTYFRKEAEEVENRNKEVAESAKGSAETLERELLKIKDLDISKMNTDEIKIKVKELTTIIKNEAFGWQGILDDVFAKEADGTFTNSVAEQLRILKEKIDEIAEAKKALSDNNDAYSNVIGSTESGSILGFGGSDIIDAMKALNKAVDENDEKLRSLSEHLRDVVSAVNFASSDNVGLSELLKGKSTIEQVEILRNYESEWAKFKAKLSEINTEAAQTVELWDSSINNITSYTVGGFLNTLLWKFGKAKEAMMTELTLSGEDINNLSEKGAQIVKGFVETSIKESSTQKPKMKQFYYDLWTEAFDIDWVDLGYIVPPTAYNNGDKGEYDASKDEVAKMWKKRSEEIDKAVKMYDQWKKLEGADKSRARVQAKDELANLFSGAYGFKLDLENPTAAYEYIQGKLNKNLSAQKELLIQLGVKISDAELKDAQDKLKQFVERTKNDLKRTTDQWDLYKQLFEATGNKEFAMTAFKVTPVWDEAARTMKDSLDKALKDAGFGFESVFDISDEDAKVLYRDLYDSWKEIKDRIEKNGIDVKVNAANAIKETMSFQERINAEESKMWSELIPLKEDSDEYLAIQKKYEESIRKLKGEWFEATPAFKALFADTADMATREVQELYEKTKNLVNLIALNTTKIHRDTEGNIVGRTYTDADGNPKYISEDSFKNLKKQSKTLGDEVQRETTVFERFWDAVRGKDKLGTGKDKGKFKGIVSDLSAIAQEAAKTSQDLSSMFDALGNEEAADIAALTGDMLNSVSQIGQGLASGNPLAVISGIANGITSIAKFHDKKLDRSIQKSQLEVKKLGNEYKNLESTLERQLGSATAGQADKMINNLEKQRTELQKQYDAEDEKKKTDKGKLEDYKQQIAELDDQIKYFYEDLASEQYGVDIKGWAGQIADALTEAFTKGEDAAVAFDKAVSEILSGLVREMIAMEVVMPAMEQLRDYMFKEGSGIFALGSEGDTSLTEKEAIGLSEKLGRLSSTIGDAQKIWDAINEASNGALKDVESSKGGLSKDIQGVTEDAANLLGSYLNSVRADVSVQRTLIEQLVSVDVPQMSIIAQAQLQQLQQVASNTKRNADAADKIYDLVNRVVDKGSNKLKI